MRPRSATLLLIAMSVGCVDPTAGDKAARSGIAEHVLRDAGGLSALVSWSTALWAIAVLCIAWVIARVARFVILLLGRGMLTPDARLVALSRVLNLVIAAWLVVFAGLRLLAAAPLMTSLFGALAVAALAFSASGPLQNVFVGLALALRTPLRVGDRIAIGEYAGIVKRVGLARLQLRCVDGSTAYIPNRLLDQHATIVDRARFTTRLSVVVDPGDRARPEAVELARRTAVLSPYRVPRSPVAVRDLDAGRRLEVVVHAWTTSSGHDAVAQLERSLHDAFTLAPRVVPHAVGSTPGSADGRALESNATFEEAD